ncbi:MAG: hypothetical protein KF809_14545 [Chloroflexi bacterium]|nr:hypothetical protein [Chloroflexota bacterium]
MLATLAAIALTGCAIGGRAGHTARATPEARFLDIAGKQAEYATTVTHFPYELPDGIAFPARVQHPAERVMFQEGAGLVEAFQFWECAWMDQAISAQPAGQPAVDVALAWLELGTASEYRTRYMDDPADIWGRQVLAPAKQGDLRVLEEFFDGCTSYRAATGR